jgi:ankyrin repeat protein
MTALWGISFRGILFLLSAVAGLASTADSTLIRAVKRSDARAVQSLLAQHVAVTTAEADGSTALHWAAQRDNLEIANLLLAAGADVKAANRFNITPLYFACTNGDGAMIERFLKAGADANSTAEQGQTALMTASLNGKVEGVKVLLAHGAAVDIKEPYKGQTALMWAASEGNTRAAEILIEFGANAKAKSTAGFTPFLFAVRNGHIDTARALLDHGANVNDTTADGTSALNMAIVNAYFELASVLLDRGANPNAPDARGSALHTLAWLRRPGSDGAAGVGGTAKGPPVPEGNVTAIELAAALLKHGANPNVRISWKEKKFDKEGGTVANPPNIDLGRHLLSYVGATPFYVAAQNGDIEYMRLLVNSSADPKISTVFGITPLMAAAGLGYWEGETPGPFTGCPESERLQAVKFALELGNDVNAHADFGTFDMIGDPDYMLLSYPKNMDELLDKGVGDPRWSGSTALHGAVVSGQASIVQFLVDHGAEVNARTKSGWTPMMLADGVFFANAKKEFPAAADILKKAAQKPGAPAAQL